MYDELSAMFLKSVWSAALQVNMLFWQAEEHQAWEGRWREGEKASVSQHPRPASPTQQSGFHFRWGEHYSLLFLKCPLLLKQSEAAGKKRCICVAVIGVFSTLVCLLCVQSVKPWSWTSSVRQSSSLSQPSPSLSSPTVLPPILDGSVETSSARDRTPALNLYHPPPPPHTAPPPARPQIPVGKTQTPVRYTSFSSSILILLGVWQE